MRPRFVLYALVLACAAGVFPAALAQEVNARYPYRLPDWYWETSTNSHLLSAEDVMSLRSDIRKLSELGKLTDTRAADSLESEIAKRLAGKFVLRDLSATALVAANPQTGVSLAVQIDPSFSPEAKATLHNAAMLFMEVALEPAVIRAAFDRSSSTPSPMPLMHETKDGKQLVDEVGRPVLTAEYSFYLKQRARPFSPAQFSDHLRNALSMKGGESAVLLISSYSGNAWWGGSYYGYFSDPIQMLGRESPSQGYFYIRLNTDKLRRPEFGWDDPAFWASKIAHELLHNLGYWHPNYKGPAERDASNAGRDWAFIVSYETAIYERLKGKK